MKTVTRILSAFVAVTVLPLADAVAFEPTGSEVGDHFLKILEASGTSDVSYGDVSTSGDQTTLQQVTGKIVEDGDEFELRIANLTLAGGSIGTDERLTLSSMDMSGLSMTSNEAAFTADAVEVSDMKFPPLADISSAAGSTGQKFTYSTAKMTNWAMSSNDGFYLPVSEMRVETSDYHGEFPRQATATISNIALSTANMPEGEGRKSLSELGYETISIDINAEASWDEEAATLTLRHVTLQSENVGNFTLSLTLGGWTEELIRELNTLDPKDEAKSKEILGKLQTTTIQDVSIQFDDKSVVGRVLDKQAEQAGISREAYVDRQVTSLNGLLSMLQNPAFQQNVTSALDSFLSNPNVLRVAASPAQPVPIAQIVGMALVAPQTIPDILGINVEAVKQD